jgi:hypothetical protein
LIGGTGAGPSHGAVVRRDGMVDNVRRPGRGAPARFAADLVTEPAGPGQVSGTGERIRLVWIGQRSVPGIEPGRWLHVEGFRADHDGVPTVFNPRYELLAGAHHD